MLNEILMVYSSIVNINYAVSVEGPVACKRLVICSRFYSWGFLDIRLKLKKKELTQENPATEKVGKMFIINTFSMYTKVVFTLYFMTKKAVCEI